MNMLGLIIGLFLLYYYGIFFIWQYISWCDMAFSVWFFSFLNTIFFIPTTYINCHYQHIIYIFSMQKNSVSRLVVSITAQKKIHNFSNKHSFQFLVIVNFFIHIIFSVIIHSSSEMLEQLCCGTFVARNHETFPNKMRGVNIVFFLPVALGCLLLLL